MCNLYDYLWLSLEPVLEVTPDIWGKGNTRQGLSPYHFIASRYKIDRLTKDHSFKGLRTILAEPRPRVCGMDTLVTFIHSSIYAFSLSTSVFNPSYSFNLLSSWATPISPLTTILPIIPSISHVSHKGLVTDGSLGAKDICMSKSLPYIWCHFLKTCVLFCVGEIPNCPNVVIGIVCWLCLMVERFLCRGSV